MSSDNNTTTNNDNKQNAGTMTTQDASRIQSAERAARKSRGRAVPLSPRTHYYDGPSSSSPATPTPYTTATRDSTADKSSTSSSSAQAKSGTGGNLADTFAARAQSAAAKNENEQDKGKGKDTKGCCIDNPEHAIVDSPSDEADKSRGPTKVCDAQ